MDDRVKVSVNKYIIETFGVDYLDTITESGPNKINEIKIIRFNNKTPF